MRSNSLLFQTKFPCITEYLFYVALFKKETVYVSFEDNDPFIVDDSLRLQGMDWGDHVLGAQFEAESLAFQAYGASTDVQYVQVQYGPTATGYNALGLMIQNRRTIIFDTELATSENDCYSPNVCKFSKCDFFLSIIFY